MSSSWFKSFERGVRQIIQNAPLPYVGVSINQAKEFAKAVKGNPGGEVIYQEPAPTATGPVPLGAPIDMTAPGTYGEQPRTLSDWIAGLSVQSGVGAGTATPAETAAAAAKSTTPWLSDLSVQKAQYNSSWLIVAILIAYLVTRK